MRASEGYTVKNQVNLKVNGRSYELSVEPRVTLLDLLRGELGLTGAKRGCDEGKCGACTVLLDGKAVKGCLVLAAMADSRVVTTIEGLAEDSSLHPLQKSFVEHGAVQCGFCTPGMVISAKALLDENPNPTEDDVKLGLHGNLCRCTGYFKIIEAVLHVAGR